MYFTIYIYIYSVDDVVAGAAGAVEDGDLYNLHHYHCSNLKCSSHSHLSCTLCVFFFTFLYRVSILESCQALSVLNVTVLGNITYEK